jgi:uncharacterized protein (TIGR03083 family)
MSDREALTAREGEAFAAFRMLCDAVPPDRREAPVLVDGWSLKDVLHHVAFWWDDLDGAMDAIRTGVPREEHDTDTENARVLAEGRALTFAEVDDAFRASRTRLLAVWADAPDAPRADEVFVSETIEHYEEHEPALRTFVDSL